MDLPPNKYKTISFSTTTMTSLGFIPPPLPKILGSPLNLAPPPSKFFFFLLRSSPPQLLWSQIFRYSPKISGEGLLPWLHHIFPTQYLPLPRFCQNLSCKLPSRTRPSIIKLEQIVFDQKSRMLWIWFCPVTTKELFLKIAAPKRQAKSLKTTLRQLAFITFASCTPGIYENNSFTSIF